MEWTQNYIQFFMDDNLIASQNIANCAQYKEPMFVLLNVAIGGTLGGAIDSTLNSATLEVDYVAHCSATTANSLERCVVGDDDTSSSTSTTTTTPTTASNSGSGGGGKMDLFLMMLFGGLLLVRSAVFRKAN
jgi:beta-glucanase (GH16 family)